MCHDIICVSFLDTILFHSSLNANYFPDPSDATFCFSPPLWSSERTSLTTNFLQNFSSFVTLAIQSCHQLLCFRCPVSTCDLLFINLCNRNNVWHRFLTAELQCSVSRERISFWTFSPTSDQYFSQENMFCSPLILFTAKLKRNIQKGHYMLENMPSYTL